MSSKNIDRAVATIKKSTATDTLKVSVTNSITQAMAQSPSWASASDVQNAVKAWQKDTAAIDTNSKTIANLRAQLKAAEAQQLGARRDWMASKKQVLASVTVFCGGSADMVKGFNLDVVTRARLGPLPAPVSLAVNPGKVQGEVVATWDTGIATHGFLVQHATDPNTAATISMPTACTKARFTLDGLPSSANVSIRVAAIDPASSTGQSPWTAWVVGNAR